MTRGRGRRAVPHELWQRQAGISYHLPGRGNPSISAAASRQQAQRVSCRMKAAGNGEGGRRPQGGMHQTLSNAWKSCKASRGHKGPYGVGARPLRAGKDARSKSSTACPNPNGGNLKPPSVGGTVCPQCLTPGKLGAGVCGARCRSRPARAAAKPLSSHGGGGLMSSCGVQPGAFHACPEADRRHGRQDGRQLSIGGPETHPPVGHGGHQSALPAPSLKLPPVPPPSRSLLYVRLLTQLLPRNKEQGCRPRCPRSPAWRQTIDTSHHHRATPLISPA